jgi:AcrR family transcriptional regulator
MRRRLRLLSVGSIRGSLEVGRKRARVVVARRGRRAAADTRKEILDVAARRLIGGGPEAIRLQDIAADVGISHPAILHHFGSRKGLVEAMVVHGLAGLQEQFLKGWPNAKEPDIEGVLERFYEVASNRGVARMLAWLVLSGASFGTTMPGIFRPAAERMHAGRVRRAREEGRHPPELEDSLFAATFLLIVVLGDSLFGPAARSTMGLAANREGARRFRRWMTRVLERLESPRRLSTSAHGKRRQH